MSAVSVIMFFEHVSLVPFHNHGYFLLNNLHILPGMDSGSECLTHVTERGCCKAGYTRGQSSTTPPSLQSRCHGPLLTFRLSPLNVHVPSVPLNISKVSGVL